MERNQFHFTFVFILFALYMQAQTPGNVTSGNCTSWFKTTSPSIYSDASATIPALFTGDIVGNWNNLAVNPAIDAVTNLITPAANVTLNTNDPYMNFNPTIEFTNGSLMKRELTRDDAFNINDGALVYGVYKTVSGARDKVFTYTYISGGNGSCGTNRCCTGFRGTRSEVGNDDLNWPNGATVQPGGNRANLIGVHGVFGNSQFNNTNGNYANGNAAGTPSSSGMYSFNIGNFPGYEYTGSIAEIFTFDNGSMSTAETARIESYLAIKYGITLGENGISKTYYNSNDEIIWNNSSNATYNTDIAGIGRDDNYQLAQTKSHSVNLIEPTTDFHDILTMVNGNDFNNPSTISTNNSYAIWGNNNGSINCSNLEIGSLQTGESILERMEREWFIQESGTIGTVVLEIDMSASNLGVWGMSNYQLIVDVDGDFSNGSNAYSPTNVDIANGKLYFTLDINSTTGYYLTIAVLEFDFSVSGTTSICNGDTTNLTIQFSGFNGLLDLVYSDGTNTTIWNGVANGDYISVSPASTTNYSFSLGATQFCGVLTDTATVTILQEPIIELGNDIYACQGETITLDALNSGSTYLWNTNSTDQQLDVTLNGLYQVEVTNADNCSTSDSINVYFEIPANAGIDGQQTWCITTLNTELNAILDSNADVGGTWYDLTGTMNGNLAGTGQLDFNGIPGMHQANYVVFGTNCPNDTSAYSITINQQPLSVPLTQLQLCNTNGELVNLNPYCANSFIAQTPYWEEISSISSNQFDSNLGIVDLSSLSQGTYHFAYILPALDPCLNDTSIVEIEITENPIIQISSDVLSGCYPLEVSFTNESLANNVTAVEWDFGDGMQSHNYDTTSHVFNEVDCFDISLTVTSNNLCTSTHVFPSYICVDPLPTAEFSFSPQQIFSIDPEVSFINESQFNDFNHWYFGDGNESSVENPVHNYELGIEGEYSVQLIVTTAAGCSDSITKTVTITEEMLVFVPNSFTPDGDQFNNTFEVAINSGMDATTYTLDIYDRWGEHIFESHDLEFGWDGTVKGAIAPVGTYIWVIGFKALDNDEKFVFRGHVNLIR